MLAIDTRKEIERRALEIIAVIEARDGKYQAEIIPDVHPHWHAITTSPGSESEAVKWLSERGFGVYLPRFEIVHVRRGRRYTQRPVLFPRHVFLFVWDIKRHWRRVKACPGVSSILTVEECPVVVSDAAIDRMQIIEFQGGAYSAMPKPKRRRRRRRGDEEQGETGDWVVTISCKSHWDNLTTLDDEGRISALHRALGLAS